MVFVYWNFTNGKRLVDVLIHNNTILKTNWYASETLFCRILYFSVSLGTCHNCEYFNIFNLLMSDYFVNTKSIIIL